MEDALISLWFAYIPLGLALYILTHHFLNKLRNLPPSPTLNLPILGHLYLLKKPLHRTLAKISHLCGPIVLLQFGSRRVLLVSSPSAAEECFTKNDIVFANRPRLAVGKHLGYNFSSLAWAPYGDHWRNLRKISSIELLSTHKLQLLQDIRADEVRSMIKRLYHGRDSDDLVDMKTVFFELTMNVVMRMIAGKRFYGENVVDAEEANRFKGIVKEAFRLGATTNVADFVPMLGGLGVGGIEKGLMELQKRRDAFMQELVEGCKKWWRSYGGSGGGGDTVVGGKTRSMIEMLLALQEEEPETYTDVIIRSMMSNLLAAGTDTSSGTMEWALSLLLNNPEILKKAQMEIDNHIGHNRLIDESDIAELPYLRCIVNETLRMYPAGPLLVPHESSEKCTVGGYLVPAGTMLLVNAWAIHNDPKNWTDSSKFKPERFEELEGTRDGFKFFPFGSGRRSCPGEGLAIRVVGFGLASVIHCFDWERVGSDLVDMTEGEGLTMPRAKPLMAYCKPRPLAAKLLSQL